MATALERSLEEKVSSLEKKAERIKSAQNTESKLSSVTDSLARLENELGSLAATAEELAFHVAVLETVFGDTRPDTVETAVSSAQKATDISDEELLEHAENLEFAELYGSVRDAETELESACDDVKERIRERHQSPWKDELASARELNRIIGDSDDEFLELIRVMDGFLEQAIWNSDKKPQTLSSRWDRLKERWERNSGKHGWDSFQDEHGLSDRTIRELKQFTSKETVWLSDLSIETLREAKEVDDLESALMVTLKSR